MMMSFHVTSRQSLLGTLLRIEISLQLVSLSKSSLPFSLIRESFAIPAISDHDAVTLPSDQSASLLSVHYDPSGRAVVNYADLGSVKWWFRDKSSDDNADRTDTVIRQTIWKVTVDLMSYFENDAHVANIT